MSDISVEDHYAAAAERHFHDGDFLHGHDRLPNADYHFGFAVECALKSMLLRFLGATMDPKPRPSGRPNTKPALAPWFLDPESGKPQEYGHLPWVESDIRLMSRRRTGARLTVALDRLSAFDRWSVHQRYLDGSDVDPSAVASRRGVAHDVIDLHQLALLFKRLP
ncbi:hypothetical protein ACIA71_04850 [Streptomyces anulatus]